MSRDEPITWCNIADGTGPQRPRKTPVLAHEHELGANNKPTVHPRAADRYEVMLKACGTVATIALTNASAHVDRDSSYARWMIHGKARPLGWLPAAACPVHMIRSGWCSPKRIVDQSILLEDPCSKGVLAEPCEHFVRECNARRSAHEEREREFAAGMAPKFRSAEERIADAVIAGNNALEDRIASALEKLVGKAKR